jgi:Ala-tRNA(Pro) deacylase
MHVPDFLAERRIAFETLLHPPAYTAQKRAKFLRVPGDQVAKSVLLRGPRGYVLAVLPATKQVQTDVVAEAEGGPVRLATDEEIARVFHDCEWGVVPPFGQLYGVPTLLDETLAPDTWMVVEVSTHTEALRLQCRDFENLEKPRRLRFAYHGLKGLREGSSRSTDKPA